MSAHHVRSGLFAVCALLGLHGTSFAADASSGPSGGRTRVGIETGGGWMMAGGVGGPEGQLGLRLGYQARDWLSIHYQGTTPVGIMAGTIKNEAGGDMAAAGFAVSLNNTLAGEYAYKKLLRIAAGPSLDYLLGGVCATDLDEALCIGGAGAKPGVDLRVGITSAPDKRGGAYLSAGAHTSFVRGAAFTSFTLNVGREWY